MYGGKPIQKLIGERMFSKYLMTKVGNLFNALSSIIFSVLQNAEQPAHSYSNIFFPLTNDDAKHLSNILPAP